MTVPGAEYGPTVNDTESTRRYAGRELEAMAFAVNYHRWILDLFGPYLGRRVLEVGAGTGAFSEMLLDSGVQELVALEPSENLFPRLEVALDRHIHRGEAFVRNQTLGEFASEGSLAAPDTVVYLNVLEHILDDQSELRSVRSIISPGGHLLIFVPAHRWLMSEIDRQFGHHRRYSIAGLRNTCRAAGFEVIGARYFDLPGIVTWWVRYRLFGSSTMEPAAVRFYDRVLVPFVRAVEDRCTPPIGKNIVMVGRAPGNPKCDG